VILPILKYLKLAKIDKLMQIQYLSGKSGKFRPIFCMIERENYVHFSWPLAARGAWAC
jgi:hypothetical protein